MTLEDIAQWYLNEEESPEVGNIGSFIDAANLMPENFRLQTFANLLSKNRDSYAKLAKSKKDWIKDIQKAAYGRQWDWGKDQVGAMFGYADPVQMFKRGKDDKREPDWYKFVGEARDPAEISKILDEYYGDPEGIKPGDLYKWLSAAQEQYDRAQKYGSWDETRIWEGIQNALRSMFAQRTQEDLMKTGDFSSKDVLGDVGENVLLGANIGRVPGMLALGLTSKFPKVARAVEKYGSVASNFVPPTEIELMDKLLYGDDPTNLRGDVSLGDITTAGAVNLGVNRGLRSGLQQAARKGVPFSDAAGTVLEDPFENFAARVVNSQNPFNVGPLSHSQGITEELLNAIAKNKMNDEFIKTKKSKLLNDMKEWLLTAPPEAIEKYRQKLNEITLAIDNPVERKKALQSFMEEFPSHLYESDYLPEEMLTEYGLTKSGTPARVAHGFTPVEIDEKYGANFFVPEDRSFKALKEQARQSHSTNKAINRESEGDRVLADLVSNDSDRRFREYPLSGNRMEAAKNYLKLAFEPKEMARTYVKNKAGQERMGFDAISDIGTNLDRIIQGIPSNVDRQKVYDLYNDEALRAMWSAEKPFVPNESPDDPMYWAWKLWSERSSKKPKAGSKAGL